MDDDGGGAGQTNIFLLLLAGGFAYEVDAIDGEDPFSAG